MPNPDEELIYSRAQIEAMENRVTEAELLAEYADRKRAALELLLVEARQVAVEQRNEHVHGDPQECGREQVQLPWEGDSILSLQEIDDMREQANEKMRDTGFRWVSEDAEL